jgi:hypothetical protein
MDSCFFSDQKKFMRYLVILVLVVFTLLASCKYNSEEDLYGAGCNTSNVNYSFTITGLLSKYQCVNCHSGGSPSGNIKLASYTDVKARVTDGKLWGSINHLPNFKAMPQTGSKMSECDISKFKAWIDNGAPNN